MQIERCNEINLIRQTLAGDTSAFDRLVKTHRTTVYVLVLSYTKNPADAEDLTQRIFIRAYERLATLRELDRFLPWLQRITHNACKDWLRRQSNSTTSFEEMNRANFTETVPTPEEIALKREIETIVREAIGTLSETDRKLVEGRYIEGASYGQLQMESGLSYAAIANRLKRAKQQIRRRIERSGMAILPGRTFIWGGIETVKLSANCIIFSLVVHLLAILMFSALRKPVVGPVEDALTVTLSTIKHPVAGAVTLVDAYNLDPLQQPPTLTPNRSNRVDVVFLISCRRTMRPYINDVVAFILWSKRDARTSTMSLRSSA